MTTTNPLKDSDIPSDAYKAKILTKAGWIEKDNLWMSPYTGNPQSILVAYCIEIMESSD